MTKNILIVNSDIAEATSIKNRISSENTNAVCARTIEEALSAFRTTEFCLVVLDAAMSASDDHTITIKHTLTSCKIDGKKVEVATDTTKTKSSRRTLPLIPQFRALLLQRWEMQEEYKRVCGSCYNTKYLEYICVDEMGNIIPPNYLSEAFPKLLARHGMRHIRFHDLRHTCASMLLKNGVPMKQIQEWLGHSDFSTTANIYAHLDYNSKLNSAEAMVTGMRAALTTVS